ncbi:UPF0149 family protein [Spartinivicinus poritis]|uniref:UPF0149 family protein n=1 Tax=Spartinivicinus poritis TaxID=2994640 RepID=A0ABT5U826_9GAMM|nr:UPF0149 family protein [Spartinivicinus sp. A2-2]MDE1462532.1 UPF0149 family protein [Spartinivicinus sp. A2-2]
MKNAAQAPSATISFDDVANLFVSLELFASPAELHGLLTGMLAGGLRLSADSWLCQVQQLLDIEEVLPDQAKVMLVSLYQQTEEQLADPEYGFRLLLPDDDAELESRLKELANWTHSFLAGFGLSGQQQAQLSTDVKDILLDFTEISQVQSEDIEEADSNEMDWHQVTEYVRINAILVFSECGSKGSTEKSDSQLH